MLLSTHQYSRTNPTPHSSPSVVPLPSSRTIQIQHTRAMRRGAPWTVERRRAVAWPLPWWVRWRWPCRHRRAVIGCGPASAAPQAETSYVPSGSSSWACGRGCPNACYAVRRPVRCPRVRVSACPGVPVSGCPMAGMPVSGLRVSVLPVSGLRASGVGVSCPRVWYPRPPCPRRVSSWNVGAAGQRLALGTGRLRPGRPPPLRVARVVCPGWPWWWLAAVVLGGGVGCGAGRRLGPRSGGGCIQVRPAGRPGPAGSGPGSPVGWLGSR
jgi:hypothetical protein